ncbi:MAG: hypothetical protein E7017_03300 [Alphaproteobacteria bacterium]|nr:hypothetical protein [Alphaproteobacteria bacterium]
MITREEALKKFEGETIEITPTDKERICIPVHNFVGAKEEEYTNWDGSKLKAKGFKFLNETDGSEQLAAVDGGVLMCYEGKTPDGKSRSEAVQEYLDKHPLAAKTVRGVEDLVGFLKTIAIGSEGKPDVYTTDLGFVSKKILGAPAKDDIKPGQMIVGQKVSSTLQAYKVGKGVEFEGAERTTSSQVAGENGAWIIKENDSGPRMIQDAEFKAAYKITKMPTIKTNTNVRE